MNRLFDDISSSTTNEDEVWEETIENENKIISQWKLPYVYSLNSLNGCQLEDASYSIESEDIMHYLLVFSATCLKERAVHGVRCSYHGVLASLVRAQHDPPPMTI
uniref:Uncharacterized protein n=1 Tax=Timema genevievae TaxID=629358 RepID=A0A7R9PP90_TIMGE|nr:unnamed protein product [Timema genevievae]